MSVDGAALLATAIRSAVLAHAPRRTVQAVAAAVTTVINYNVVDFKVNVNDNNDNDECTCR